MFDFSFDFKLFMMKFVITTNNLFDNNLSNLQQTFRFRTERITVSNTKSSCLDLSFAYLNKKVLNRKAERQTEIKRER